MTVTNEEKFKEVFGFVPNDTIKQSVCPEYFDCADIQCYDCQFCVRWWQKEYDPCFKLDEVKKRKS